MSDAKGDASAEACQAECCHDNRCSVWQWRPLSQGAGAGCWRGHCQQPPTPAHGWIGGQREAPTSQPPTPAPTPSAIVPAEAEPNYNDQSWQAVNAPHDSLIGLQVDSYLCPDGCSGRSYIPRDVSWYRKHFALPAEWQGDIVSLYFEGIFRECQIWLNGKSIGNHTAGYTSFEVPLSDGPLNFGDTPNVLAITIDPNKGRSGWWYEGSGLYRHIRLRRTCKTRLDTNGIFAYSNVSSIETQAAGSRVATSATLHISAAVSNADSVQHSVSVKCTLTSLDGGQSLGTATSAPISLPPNDAAASKASLRLVPTSAVSLWAINQPTLYQLVVEVLDVGDPTKVLDAVNITTGFRSLRYTAEMGMYLNEQHVKVRGFCDHK